MSSPTPHNDYFSPSGKFIGMRTLQKDFIEKSESFFSNSLWQTNTDNQLSLQKYSNDFNKKAKIFFEEAMNQNHNSFDYKFSCVLLSNYLTNLDSFLTQKDSSIESKYLIKSPLRYTKNQNFEKKFLVRLFLNPIRKDLKTLLSNKNKVDRLLDYLTEILFHENKNYNGLEQIWILFLENIISHKKKFAEEEKEIKILSKKHYETFITRAKPFSWGWYEIHIKCFSNSFIDTLADCLTLKSNFVIDSKELDNIYGFSKEVLGRMEIVDKGKNDSKGFLILGDFIKSNLNKLSEAIGFYENNIVVEQDYGTYIEESNNNKSNKVKTPYNEEQFNISKNLNYDFIDYFTGESRRERESDFMSIINLLIKNKSKYRTIIVNKQCKYGIQWADKDKNTGKPITALIQTLIDEGWIRRNDDTNTEIIKKFKDCFGISDWNGITKRNFEKEKLSQLMGNFEKKLNFIERKA